MTSICLINMQNYWLPYLYTSSQKWWEEGWRRQKFRSLTSAETLIPQKCQKGLTVSFAAVSNKWKNSLAAFCFDTYFRTHSKRSLSRFRFPSKADCPIISARYFHSSGMSTSRSSALFMIGSTLKNRPYKDKQLLMLLEKKPSSSFDNHITNLHVCWGLPSFQGREADIFMFMMKKVDTYFCISYYLYPTL